MSKTKEEHEAEISKLKASLKRTMFDFQKSECNREIFELYFELGNISKDDYKEAALYYFKHAAIHAENSISYFRSYLYRMLKINSQALRKTMVQTTFLYNEIAKLHLNYNNLGIANTYFNKTIELANTFDGIFNNSEDVSRNKEVAVNEIDVLRKKILLLKDQSYFVIQPSALFAKSNSAPDWKTKISKPNEETSNEFNHTGSSRSP